jgi:hypothetical protein
MWCFGLLVSFCLSSPTPPIDSYCQIARPIYWSAHDTRATKAAVDRHNRVWKATCSGQ